jgi:hypothetical protein
MTPPTLLALLLAVIAAAAPRAQTPQPTPAPPAADAAKLAEWPALKDADKAKALALIEQFRKPETKLHEPAHKALVALGAGAAPLLMQQCVDRVDGVNGRLFAVLDEMLGRPHAALMARESKKPRTELRRYLVRRLCRMGDKDLTAYFESMAADADPETAFCARLGAYAQGKTAGLPQILERCTTDWPTMGPIVADAFTPARSRELALPVFETIAAKGAVEQMAGLRLLRYLMVKEQGVLLHRYLDASEHTVRREAINAARCLHGEAPIENLSVFQSIELAKQWRGKV